MFGNAFSGWHLILILVLVLLLFGAAKLPALAKSVGESVRIIKKESRTAKQEQAEDAAATTAAPAAVTPAPAAAPATAAPAPTAPAESGHRPESGSSSPA
ncbi:twin-arginine translocase TatA/TatE family subunit [Microbacterium sp. LMI1-1-1.1]|uniref:twin-arginine translocase TatA/TatE family subunit n=1 Tax=unclassified Microbacterium TaxID=2609290 RepID=UPI003467BE0C